MRRALQGAFDGLCGVYAIINALDLVGLAQPRSRLHKAMFVELTRGLGAAALRNGMDSGLTSRDLMRAVKPAFRWLEAETGVALTLSKPLARRRYREVATFVDDLRDHVDEPGVAVILQVRIGTERHWTVARTFCGRSLLLRDSWGRRSLPLPLLQLHSGHFRVTPAETLLVQSAERAALRSAPGGPPDAGFKSDDLET